VIQPHPPFHFRTCVRESFRSRSNMDRSDHKHRRPARPITVHIARIGLLRAETPVDEYVLNTGQPKCFDGGPQAFQEPRRRGVNPNRLPISSSVPYDHLVARTSGRVESRNHIISIMSGTSRNVNTKAVIVISRLLTVDSTIEPNLEIGGVVTYPYTVSRRCVVSHASEVSSERVCRRTSTRIRSSRS